MKISRTKAPMEWFGAKTIYRYSEGTAKGCFEERVVLFKAQGFTQATRAAEAEARQYAKDVGGCKYLGFVDVFQISEKTRTGHGTEVYSLMRESRLNPRKYLNRFHDTGNERTQSA